MLRLVLIGLGLIALSLLTLVACIWLASNAGHLAVFSLCLTSGMAAWVAHALAKETADAAAGAVRDCGWSLKEAAAQIDMDLALASRQLSGERRFEYAEWAKLGPRWEAAFARRRARGYSVIEDGVVAQALAKLTSLLDGKVTA